MLYLDKYSNRRLMKGREHPHFLLSTITANLFVYAQAFEFFFFKFAARNAGFLREVTVKERWNKNGNRLSSVGQQNVKNVHDSTFLARKYSRSFEEE